MSEVLSDEDETPMAIVWNPSTSSNWLIESGTTNIQPIKRIGFLSLIEKILVKDGVWIEDKRHQAAVG